MIELMNDLGFEISWSSIIAGLIFGIVGFYTFRFGRKIFDPILTLIGILLMSYGMFTRGPWQDWGLGLALSAFAYWRYTDTGSKSL